MDSQLELWLAIEFARCWFPPGARCSCGETRPIAFLRKKGTVVCYACQAERRGRGRWEWHHLGGSRSPFPPVLVGANDHRLLSMLQATCWQGRVPSGSDEALAFDVFALLMVTVLIPIFAAKGTHTEAERT